MKAAQGESLLVGLQRCTGRALYFGGHYNNLSTSTACSLRNVSSIHFLQQRSYATDDTKRPLGGIFDKFSKNKDKQQKSNTTTPFSSVLSGSTVWKGKVELEREKITNTLGEYGFLPEATLVHSEIHPVFDEHDCDVEATYDPDATSSFNDVSLNYDEGEEVANMRAPERDMLEELLENVTEHEEAFSEPSWFRDFTKKHSEIKTEYPEPAVNVPTSWYKYAPHSADNQFRMFDDNLSCDNLGIEESDVDGEDSGYESLVYMGRHTKVTGGGRHFSFSAMVIDGDGNGTAGYGYGRGEELDQAVNAARKDLRKNLIHIDRFEGRTLAEPVRAKFGRSICQLFVYPIRQRILPEVPGCLQMQRVFRAFGLENVGGKFIGSRNRKNCIKALFKAIRLAEHPKAKARKLGVKWVDIGDVWRRGKPRVWTY